MDSTRAVFSATLKRGDQFGKYSLLERIGSGGEATVWSAWDHLRQRVLALKLMPRGGDEAETGSLRISSNFEHQIHLIASLNHPNILPLYEFGETGNYYYFAMRYGAAGSLATRMDNQRLTLEETLHCCVQIAAALQHLHERRIIHRDLKPSNIVMDTQNRLYLSDFGLSKNLNQETVPLHTGRGTGPYAPYEQFARMEVSYQSDIFSFGVMAYEMFNGELPWGGTDSLAVRQAKEFAELPEVTTLEKGLSAGITEVLRNWTAFKPEHRPLNAQEAMEMLVDVVREKKGRSYPIPAPLPPNIEEGVVLAQDASVMLGRLIAQPFDKRQAFPLRLTHLALIDAALRPGLPNPLPLDDRLRLCMLRGALTYNHNLDFWYRLANTPAIRWQACQSVILTGDETAAGLALERWSNDQDTPPVELVVPELRDCLLDWVERAQTWPVRQNAIQLVERLSPSSNAWQPVGISTTSDHRLADLALEGGPLAETAAHLLGRMRSRLGLDHLLAALGSPPSPQTRQALLWLRQASNGLPSDISLVIRARLGLADMLQRARDENLPVYPLGGVIGLVIGLLTAVMFLAGWFAPYRLAAQDALMLPYPVSGITTIVEINDSSLAQYGRWGEWPRSLHAQLIDQLSQMGARAIVLDYVFAEPAAGDAQLVQAMQKAGVVVQPVLGQGDAILDTPGVARYSGLVTPQPLVMQSVAALGHTNVLHDADGIVRKMPVTISGPEGRYASLPLAALAVYLGHPQSAAPPLEAQGDMQLLGRTAPVGRYAELWTHFAGAPATTQHSVFRKVSLQELMAGSVPTDWIKDKLVLVGITATAEPDRYLTPVSQGRPMYGVEILANQIETIWTGRFIRPASEGMRVGVIILLALLAGLFSRSPRQNLIAAAVLAVLTFGGVSLAFDWLGWQFDLFFPGLAIGLAAVTAGGVRYATLDRRYHSIRSDLRQRANPEVQQAAMQALHTERISLQQKMQDVTVLAVNLSGLNPLTGQLSPEQVRKVKDTLENLLRKTALENGGALLDMSGNTWAAIFNAPLPQADHTQRAIRVAIDICRQWQLERLAYPVEHPARQVELPMGISIGRSLVGYAQVSTPAGPQHRFEAIGQGVELAAQLCQFAAGGQILLTGQGAERLEEDGKIEVFSTWYLKALKTSLLTYVVYP